MKIIKTKSASPNKAVVASTDVSDSDVFTPTKDSESEQFTSIMLTTDGFKAILENAKLPDELMQLLIDRFNIIPLDKGVATGIVGNWLSEQLDSFTEQQLLKISDGVDIGEIANYVLESNVDEMRIRTGYLSSRYYIPLIGESKNAILKKFRN